MFSFGSDYFFSIFGMKMKLINQKRLEMKMKIENQFQNEI